MKFCVNCGAQLVDDAVACPSCGAYCEVTQQNNQVSSDDTGSIGYAFLSCCVPIVGLILWLVWKDVKPKNAKKAGIGALIGVGCIVVYYILVLFLGFAMGFASTFDVIRAMG